MNIELFKSLYKQGLTDVQISEQTGETIHRVRCNRYYLNLKYDNLIINNHNKIVELSNLNLTDSEISRQTGISMFLINKYRKDHNLNSSSFTKTIFKTTESRIKGKMLVRSRTRAKQLNIEFNIEAEDLILNEYCPILNIKLDYIKKEMNNMNAASLDRIDNSKGYIKGNVMIISVLANTMKSNASIDQLYSFCNNIKNILDNIT